MRLRSYLILLVVAAVLPVVLFAGAMTWLSSRQQIAAQEEELADIAHAISLDLDRELFVKISALEVLTKSAHLETGDLKGFHERALSVLQLHPGWDTIALTDPSGRQAVNVKLPFGSPLPFTDSPFVKEIFRTRRPVVSNFFFGSLDERPLIAVGVPVIRDEKLLYSLAVSASPAFLADLLKRQKLPSGWIATIIDRDKTIVARTQNLDQFLGHPAGSILAAKSRESAGGSLRGVTREEIAVAMGFRRSELSGWTVAVAIPAALLEAPARRALIYTGGGGLLLLCLGVLLAAVLGRRIARPVSALAGAAEKVGRGEIPEVPPLPIVEVNRVAREIERAAARREAADRARNEAHRLVNTIFETAPVGLAFLDRELRFVHINEELAAINGLTVEEHLGRTFREVLPGLAPALEPLYRQVLGSGEPLTNQEITAEMPSRPGKIRHWLRSYYPVKSPGQEIIGVGVVVQDITERRRSEAALRQSQEKYEDLYQNAPDMYVSVEAATGKIIECNQTMLERTGYSRDEVLGRPVFEFYDPDSVSAANRAFEIFRATGEIEGVELQVRRKDGRILDVSLKSTAVRDHDGRILYTRSSWRDITERRRAEAALRESEHQLRLFVEHSPAAIAMLDRDMKYLVASRRWVSDYNLKDQDIVGRSHYELFPELPERWKKIHRRCLAGAVEGCEADPFPRADGTIDWVRWAIRPWHDARGNVGGLIIFSEVITERKRAEDLLDAERRFLEMIARAMPLAEFMDRLAREVEALSPHMMCSVLLLDPDEVHVRRGAAPSLPRAYSEAIDGEPIGPRAGSCGTAAYLKKQVIVSDIAADPLWENYRELALTHGLRACWSTPILSASGSVLGTFAMYYREPRSPKPWDLELIERFTHLIGIAIERSQTIQELRESRTRLQLAVSASGIGPWDWDLVTNSVVFSAEWKRQIGYEDHEIENRYEEWESRLHPDDREPTLAALQGYLAGEVAEYAVEFRLHHKDGSYRWIYTRGEVLRDGSGKPVRMLGCHLDITERKQAEEKLRSSEQQLRNVIDGLGPEMFVGLLTPDGKLIEVNQPALAVAGLKPEDVLGKPLEETYWLSHSEAVQRRIRQAIEQAARGDASRFDVEIRVGENQLTVIDFSLQPLRDENGNVVFLVPSANDITERKRAEEALRASEEEFRQLAENIDNVFWLTSPDKSQMIYVSPAYDRIWGRSSDGLYREPRSWLDAIQPEDRGRVMEAAGLQVRGDYDIEYRIVRPDGSIRWIRDRAFPIRDDSGTVYRVAGVAEDITQLKLQSDELARAARDASVGRIAASVAHEVNNPLFAIKMRLDSLKKALSDRADAQERLDVVSTQLDRIGRAVKSLLGYFRQRFALGESIVYGELIRTVTDLFYGSFNSRKIGLDLNVPDALPAVSGSIDELQELLINLLENAREALAEGQMVYVSAAVQDGNLEIRVEDDGPGLGDDPERLFQPFYTTKSTGTGLGLTIARQICERRGGKLFAENRKEGGARFRIVLPLARGESATQP